MSGSVAVAGKAPRHGKPILVWGRANSLNVQKVLWCLGEIRAEFQLILTAGAHKGTDTAEFLAMNPNGLVPVIRDHDAVLWESNTIVRYLASQYSHGGICRASPLEQAMCERWMDWYSTMLSPNMTVLWNSWRRGKETDKSVLANATTSAERGWNIVASRMQTSAFLEGAELSVGDLVVGVALHRWVALADQVSIHPVLRDWYERLCARSSYAVHVAAAPD